MGNFFNDNEGLKFHLHHELMEEIVRLKERDYADKDKYDFAPENFEDAIDSYERVLGIIGEISSDVLWENAESVDKQGPRIENNAIIYADGTQKNHQALTDAGVYGLSLPRQYGGLNFSYVPYVMAAEIVSRGDCGFANIWGLQDCAETIYEFASEEIKNEYQSLVSPCVRIGGRSSATHIPAMKQQNTAVPMRDSAIAALLPLSFHESAAPAIQHAEAPAANQMN